MSLPSFLLLLTRPVCIGSHGFLVLVEPFLLGFHFAGLFNLPLRLLAELLAPLLFIKNDLLPLLGFLNSLLLPVVLFLDSVLLASLCPFESC